MQKSTQKTTKKPASSRVKKVEWTIAEEKKEVEKTTKKRVVQKKRVRDLTPMQEKAVTKLVEQAEKGGKIVLGKAVKDAWYGEEVQRNPKKVFWKPAVQRRIKDLKIDPVGIKDMHERLANWKRLEVLQYSLLVPEEDIVRAITENIKGAVFLKSTAYPEFWSRHYQFMMPSETALAKALDIAYKLFPPKPQADPAMDKTYNKKRLEKLEELAKNLKLRKPLKLWKQ